MNNFHIVAYHQRYYFIDEFNSMKFHESRFSPLHLNARSLYKNIDQLALFINSLNHTFSIIAISETWENKDIPSKPHLPGYSCVSIPRSGRGRGVALFIKDTIIILRSLNVYWQVIITLTILSTSLILKQNLF